jgi:hypothetical protein
MDISAAVSSSIYYLSISSEACEVLYMRTIKKDKVCCREYERGYLAGYKQGLKDGKRVKK